MVSSYAFYIKFWNQIQIANQTHVQKYAYNTNFIKNRYEKYLFPKK